MRDKLSQRDKKIKETNKQENRQTEERDKRRKNLLLSQKIAKA